MLNKIILSLCGKLATRRHLNTCKQFMTSQISNICLRKGQSDYKTDRNHPCSQFLMDSLHKIVNVNITMDMVLATFYHHWFKVKCKPVLWTLNSKAETSTAQRRIWKGEGYNNDWKMMVKRFVWFTACITASSIRKYKASPSLQPVLSEKLYSIQLEVECTKFIVARKQPATVNVLSRIIFTANSQPSKWKKFDWVCAVDSSTLQHMSACSEVGAWKSCSC